MRRPFSIVDGYVDLDAAVVVRQSGVRVLSPAETMLLGALQDSPSAPVPPQELAEILWALDGRSDRLEPLLWSLRRKLAPSIEVLVRDEGGLRLVPATAAPHLEILAIALTDSAEVVPQGAGIDVEALDGGQLWVAPDAEALLEALLLTHEDEVSHAALDLCMVVDGRRTLSLQAGLGRLRRLLPHGEGPRILMSDAASRVLRRPIQAGGTWFRSPGGPVETCWTLSGMQVQPPLAALSTTSPNTGLAGRDDELAACWAAIEAGAAAIVLHGPPGTGRTAMAECLAQRCTAHLGREWRAVEVHVAGTTDAESMRLRLSVALGVSGEGTDAAVSRALASLSPMLLLADDLDEASPEAVQALLEVRALSPRCVLVATSRRPVRLPGALQVELGPLEPAAAGEFLLDRTRGVAGWERLAADGPLLEQLVSSVQTTPAALLSLVSRAELMSPDLLLEAIQADARGSSPHPGEAVLGAALERLPTNLRAALSRLALLPGSLDLDDVSHALAALDVQPLAALRRLIEGALVRTAEDRVLAESRFNVPRAVRELVGASVSEAERELWCTEHALAVADRAGAWADDVAAGLPERALLRRLELAAPVLRQVLQTPAAPQAWPAARALMVLWEGGQQPFGPLLGVLHELQVPAAEADLRDVMRARLMCDAGQHRDAADIARGVVGRPGPLGELARMHELDLEPLAERRGPMGELARRLLDDVQAERLGLLPEMLDYLLISGFFADVAEIAVRHAALAAARGSRWRAAQLGLQAFRARAALGKQRPQDLRAARHYLQTLREHLDYRRSAAGLQCLSRALTASGDPRSALDLLDRLGGTLEAWGPWSVRHMARLDRARAHALLGEVQAAYAQVEAFRHVERQGPSLPAFVADLDEALVALIALDAETLERALDRVGEGATAHHRLAVQLGAVSDVMQGRPVRDGIRPRSSSERLLDGLTQAWALHDAASLHEARAALRQAPEWRSIALAGVALRAADRAAELALDRAAQPD